MRNANVLEFRWSPYVKEIPPPLRQFVATYGNDALKQALAAGHALRIIITNPDAALALLPIFLEHRPYNHSLRLWAFLKTHGKQPKPTLESDIFVLELRPEVYTLLRSHGIDTVGQLVRHTEEGLRKIRQLDMVRLAITKERLQANGFELKQD